MNLRFWRRKRRASRYADERHVSRVREAEARYLRQQILRIQQENHFAENIIKGLTEGHGNASNPN